MSGQLTLPAFLDRDLRFEVASLNKVGPVRFMSGGALGLLLDIHSDFLLRDVKCIFVVARDVLSIRGLSVEDGIDIYPDSSGGAASSSRDLPCRPR